jgi:hypothetical protein
MQPPERDVTRAEDERTPFCGFSKKTPATGLVEEKVSGWGLGVPLYSGTATNGRLLASFGFGF